MSFFNYTDIFKLAKEKLSLDHKDVVSEIDSLMGRGSTGGEVNGMVAGFLKGLKDRKHPAYELLRPEVDAYLSQFILH